MEKRQIVFIEPHQTVMVYKIASEFRNRGYETILIRLLKPDKTYDNLFKKAYDNIIDLNLKHSKISRKNIIKITFILLKNLPNLIHAFKKIIFLKPYVVIGRAPLSLPIAFFRIIFKKVPFIYFPYDIRQHSLVKNILNNTPKIELRAERYCYEKSDGILHKGSPDELNYINGRAIGNNIKFSKLNLSFPPYCSNELIVPLNKNKLSMLDKEIHFVYIAGTGKPNSEFYFLQLNFFRNILSQKIHVHTYYSSDVEFNKKQDNEKQKAIIDFYEKCKDNPNIKYYHIHKSLSFIEIIKEISKYDFGTTHPKILINSDLEPKFNTANKIASYLEAGLPFFSHSNYLFTNSLMKKYNISLIFPNDFKDLRKAIKKIDKKKFNRNILIAQKDFNVNKQFSKLEEFVKKVVESKNKHNFIK